MDVTPAVVDGATDVCGTAKVVVVVVAGVGAPDDGAPDDGAPDDGAATVVVVVVVETIVVVVVVVVVDVVDVVVVGVAVIDSVVNTPVLIAFTAATRNAYVTSVVSPVIVAEVFVETPSATRVHADADDSRYSTR